MKLSTKLDSKLNGIQRELPPIVRIAAEKYILSKIPPLNTIRSHVNICDFILDVNPSKIHDTYLISNNSITSITDKKKSVIFTEYGSIMKRTQKNTGRVDSNFLYDNAMVCCKVIETDFVPVLSELNLMYYISLTKIVINNTMNRSRDCPV